MALSVIHSVEFTERLNDITPQAPTIRFVGGTKLVSVGVTDGDVISVESMIDGEKRSC